MKKRRHNLTREERREIRNALFALAVTGVIVMALPFAFLRAFELCAW
jgi:hypothetical protein